MVAAYAGKCSIKNVVPELFHILLSSHWRSALSRCSLLENEILCESKIVRTGLSCNRKTFVLCILNNLSNHRMAYMADVDSSACCSCHVDNIFSSHILSPYIVRIQEGSDFLFSGHVSLCLCLLFSFKNLAVLFTVESAKCVIRLENLKGFTDISHIYCREQRPIWTSEPLECSNASLLQINQVCQVVVY